MNKTSLICLLDKAHPPDHSFVSGMLCNLLPRNGIAVRLIVASPEQGPLVPQRYLRSVSLPVLPSYPHRGWRRIKAVAQAYYLVLTLIRRERRRNREVILFVRNDALSLLVAGLLRPAADLLLFQSSFPFERAHGGRAKKFVHRSLYRLAGRRVDGILAVSPLALERVAKLVSSATREEWIPLLSDLSRAPSSSSSYSPHDRGESTRFLYAGTHKSPRQLEVVLQGIVQSTERGIGAQFTFLGGNEQEIQRLRMVRGVDELEEKGVLMFRAAIPRDEMAEMMSGFDVGLSLIPPSPIYAESAPTKLAEYMGAGLAVLASNGIAWQEMVIRESGAGVLVDFRPTAIAEGIQRLTEDRSVRERMREAATEFASGELTYEAYLPAMMRLMGHAE